MDGCSRCEILLQLGRIDHANTLLDGEQLFTVNMDLADKGRKVIDTSQPKLGFVPIGTGGGACKFAGFLGAGGGGGFRAIEADSSVGAGD